MKLRYENSYSQISNRGLLVPPHMTRPETLWRSPRFLVDVFREKDFLIPSTRIRSFFFWSGSRAAVCRSCVFSSSKTLRFLESSFNFVVVIDWSVFEKTPPEEDMLIYVEGML